MKRQSKIKFIVFFLCGFLFRLLIMLLYPSKTLYYDQTVYVNFAHEIQNSFFIAYCCSRTYVYPLFLAGILKYTAAHGIEAVKIFQVLLDTVTATMLFMISLKVFRKETWAWGSFFVYLFNPLTASFTPLILTEILAIFLLVAALLFLIRKENFYSQFFFGLTLGLFTFTRIMFWWWSIMLLLALIVYKLKLLKDKRWKIIFVILGFTFSLIYPVLANYRYYRTW